MSGEVLVRIRPGESVDEFTSRIANSAPPLTPSLADRLRSLLAVDVQTSAGQVAHLPERAAA